VTKINRSSLGSCRVEYGGRSVRLGLPVAVVAGLAQRCGGTFDCRGTQHPMQSCKANLFRNRKDELFSSQARSPVMALVMQLWEWRRGEERRGDVYKEERRFAKEESLDSRLSTLTCKYRISSAAGTSTLDPREGCCSLPGIILGFLAEAAPRLIRGTRALDPVPRLQRQPCEGLYASDGTTPLTGPPPSRSINLSLVFAAARSLQRA
jgi:hypothetical protein